MKYKVNENCIACGLCEATCPEVFVLEDSGHAVAIRESDESNDELAQTAMEDCPVDAIEKA